MGSLFLSHSSEDDELSRVVGDWLVDRGYKVFLDFHHHAGIDPGEHWEQKLYDELRACQAVVVLCSEHSMASRWCFVEITHARSLGKHVFPLKIDDCEVVDVLKGTHFVDLTRMNRDEAFERLGHGLAAAGITAGSPFDRDPERPLYPGLLAYDEKDAAIFFGRDSEIGRGVDVLNRTRSFGGSNLVMTLGASGSGKSSLVRAGIVPRLKLDRAGWVVVDAFRPGDDPFGNLARAVSRTRSRLTGSPHEGSRGDEAVLRLRDAAGDGEPLGDAPATAPEGAGDDRRRNVERLIAAMEDLLRQPPAGTGRAEMELLRSSLRRWKAIRDRRREPPDSASDRGRRERGLATLGDDLLRELAPDREAARLLLVVDQFEELLGGGRDGASAAFLHRLREMIDDRESRVVVLGTMRSDFLGSFQQEPDLVGCEFSEILVGPMLPAALREIIVSPAEQVGVEFEPLLVQRLLDAASGRDSLPLLAFTLRRLYEEYTSRRRREGVGSTVRAAGAGSRRPTVEESHYDAIGGLRGSVGQVASQVLAAHRLTAERENDLRIAFVGRLARFDEDGKPVRRVARRDDLPESVRDVLDGFIEARLLVTGGGAGERTLEVAHEALFSSWDTLKGWLDRNREFLLWRSRLAVDLADWEDRGALLTGPALTDATHWLERDPGLLDAKEREFIRLSRRRRRRTVGIVAGLAAAVVVIISVLGVRAHIARLQAERQTARVMAVQAGSGLHERPDVALTMALEAHRVADSFESRSSLRSLLSENASLDTMLHYYGRLAWTVTFSPDGGTLASAGNSGIVGLHDTATRTAIGVLPDPAPKGDSIVYSLAFHPDRETLASAGNRGLYLWDEVARELRRGEAGPALSEGVRVAALGEGWLVGDLHGGVHQLSSVGVSESLGAHGAEITTLAVGGDGDRFVSGDASGAVRLWRRADGSPAWASTALQRPVAADGGPRGAHDNIARAALLESDGLHVLTSGGDSFVRFWDQATGAWVGELDTGQKQVWSLAFCAGFLFSAGDDGAIQRWTAAGDRPAGRPYHPAGTLGRHLPDVRSLACSPDGGTLASTGFDGTVRLWDVTTGGIDFDFYGHANGIDTVALSAASGIAASGDGDGLVRLWDLRTGALRLPLPAHAEREEASSRRVRALAFDPAGRRLASGSSAGEVRVWDLDRVLAGDTVARLELAFDLPRTPGASVEEHAALGDGVWSVAWSPDGGILAIGLSSGTGVLVDLASGEERCALERQLRRVRALAFSPDGATLATGSEDEVRLWSTATCEEVTAEAFTGHPRGVLSLVFGRDGERLYVGAAAGSVHAWDVARAARLAVLTGHESEVRALRIDPDGSRLASASSDKTVRVWDVSALSSEGETPRSVARFQLSGHQDRVQDVAFVDGGLTSGSSDGTARRWVVHADDLQGEVCRRVNRNLTPTEWAEIFGEHSEPRRTCPGAKSTDLGPTDPAG